MSEQTERPIVVLIRREIDGEVREREDTGYFGGDFYEAGVFQEYIWSEGNYSCDCNRSLFFGERNPDDRGCSDGLYRIRILDAASRDTLYDEWASA